MINWEALLSDLLKIGIPSLISIVLLIANLRHETLRQNNEILEQDRKQTAQKKEEFISSIVTYQIGLRDYFACFHNYLSNAIQTVVEMNELIKEGIPRQQASEIKIKTLAITYFPRFLDSWNIFMKLKSDAIKEIMAMEKDNTRPIKKSSLDRIIRLSYDLQKHLDLSAISLYESVTNCNTKQNGNSKEHV